MEITWVKISNKVITEWHYVIKDPSKEIPETLSAREVISGSLGDSLITDITMHPPDNSLLIQLWGGVSAFV